MASSCNSSKSTADDSAAKAEAASMIAKGYTLATVVLQPTEQGCPTVLKTDSELLDPINLKPEFAKDQMKVWITFARLRRMNRCDMAGPVSITEIKKAN